MGIELTALHWVYLLFVFIIIGFMVMKRDTSFACIAGIFVLGLIGTSSMVKSITGVFNSFIYAITELLGTILIISIIVAMSKILSKTGVNEMMIRPFTKLIRNPTLAYWVIGILMMVISWFFWPSPAVALMGAVLLPVAVKVGLPPIAVAMAMNLFGHGIALSGDFVIQGAPKLTAGGAGIPVGDVVSASVPLVIVMGVVTTITAFIMIKRDLKKRIRKDDGLTGEEVVTSNMNIVYEKALSPGSRRILAVMVPLIFAADVVTMYVAKLQGGDATALIGGTAVFILVVMTLMAYKDKGFEEMTSYLIEGFQFGFKIFGPVIPIAAFFYLGDSGFIKIFGEVLPAGSQGIVNDLGIALAGIVPLNPVIGGVTSTLVGTITGLDGSGFSGISLAGSVARLFSVGIGSGIATMTALGQIAAIWVGGGTLIPWALIPAAAICGVDPFELARKNLIPVIVGLAVTTIVAIFLI